jgi:hypothetical protein
MTAKTHRVRFHFADLEHESEWTDPATAENLAHQLIHDTAFHDVDIETRADPRPDPRPTLGGESA